MSTIATYVFLDLETTGLPKEENNRTRITEISLVAVKREHVLETRSGATPRVQHKLTLCLNPGRLVAPTCTEVTGLCNYLLEYEPSFTLEVYTIINTFLDVLEKPVCLVAQNGHRFDFPILKNHLKKLGVNFSNDLLCADCLHGFYDILEGNTNDTNTITNANNDNVIVIESDSDKSDSEARSLQSVNERTPTRRTANTNGIRRPKPISRVRRKLFWTSGDSPVNKYKLLAIYERIFEKPAEGAHRAENDCIIALLCFVAKAKEMVKWFDENNCLFSEVKPMTPGVPLGD